MGNVMHDKTGLNAEERKIMNRLSDAWSIFVFLDDTRDDERDEFLDAIHQAQSVLAHRALGRLSPEYWRGGGEDRER